MEDKKPMEEKKRSEMPDEELETVAGGDEGFVMPGRQYSDDKWFCDRCGKYQKVYYMGFCMYCSNCDNRLG